MARPRQPLALIEAKGKKHLTKAEIEERRAAEVQPCTDDLTAPAYLTATEKKRFDKLADQLAKLNILGETDTEALARYVTAQSLYEKAVKDLRKTEKERPKRPGPGAEQEEHDRFYDQMHVWSITIDLAIKRQDRYFKQAATAAAALGLTISSRCKLVAPAAPEAPKENKFLKFSAAVNE